MLIKPANVTYAEIVEESHQCLLAIDAGLGHATLAELIHDSRGIAERQLAMYATSMRVEEYSSLPLTWPFMHLRAQAKGLSPMLLLHRVFQCLSTVLVLHAHLDHILALVVNLPLLGPTDTRHRVQVLGLDFTMSALRNHIFNGIIWPDLPLLKLFDLVTIPELRPMSIVQGAYTVTTFEVAHGHISVRGHDQGLYMSLAFLVQENTSRDKILVFGDFELDTSSLAQKNALVWSHVAPFVVDQSLKCIVLECSTSIVDSHMDLYGHLTPTHVIEELLSLERLCAASRPTPLKGLDIIVTHVKDDVSGVEPRQKVLRELQQLSDSKRLFLRFSMALNGILMVI